MILLGEHWYAPSRRGVLIKSVDKDVWGVDPVVACPTYNFKTGKFGPEYKQTGLAGFVNTWAKTATINNASQDVSAFVITKDEQTGQVFCKER